MTLYGNSLPFLGLQILHQLAKEEGTDFLKAGVVLRTQTNVGDIVT